MKKEFKRAIHFDFHTVAGIPDLLKDFDADDFAETLRAAGVKYINFTAMCNNGYCYYPTEIGTVYPGLTRDIFGEVISACRKRGIGVTAYFNAGINFEAAKNHLSWCRIDEQGKNITEYNNFVHDCDRRKGNYFTRSMCLNNPDYKKFLTGIIGEILRYEPDGLFADGFYPEPCYCPVCIEKMLKAGADIGNAQEVFDFQKDVVKLFSREIKALAGEERYLFFNNDRTPEDMMNTHAEIEILPSWTWLHYEGFYQRAAFLRNIFKKRIYMTGRFQRDWGDFGGIRPKAALENDVWDAFLQGYDISFGDHIDPVRGINKDMYKVIGEIYSQAEKTEEYRQGAEYVAEIAVLSEKYDDLLNVRNRGAAHILHELHYTFDFIAPYMDFSKYRLIIIPDSFEMSDMLAEKLEKYIRAGGRLLTSGVAGLNKERTGFALSCYEFVKFDGLDESKRAYFSLNNGFCDYGNDNIWSVYYITEEEKIGGTGIKMLNNGGEECASYVSAYFDVMRQGLHGCYYTPPKEKTEFSMAVCGKKAAHIAFEVFGNYGVYFLQAHKILVKQIIEKLMPESLLVCENIPFTSKLSLTRKPEYDLLHIKVSYPEHRNFRAVIEEHNTLKSGATVSVRGKYTSAVTLPEGEKLEICYKNGYTAVRLPEITGYAMIKLTRTQNR